MFLILSAVFSYDLYVFFPATLWFLLLMFLAGSFNSLLQPFLMSKFGGDIGKLLVGLKVIHEDGSLLTFKRAFFRESIAKMASGVLLWLGFFWILKDPKRQGWHDMLADTYVVRSSPHSVLRGFFSAVVLLFATVSMFVFSTWALSRSNLVNYSYEQVATEIPKEFDLP